MSHFTTACFDHIFRHMESIWTTHENLLISNLIFLRKKKLQDDTSQRKRKIARMWDRDPFEIFEEKHVEAERFAIASVFTIAIPIDISREKLAIFIIARWIFHRDFNYLAPVCLRYKRWSDLESGIPIGQSWSWSIGHSSEFRLEILDRCRSMRPYKYISIVNDV